MTYSRCERCRGRKKVIGLGMIEKDCYDCHGVGFVKLGVVAEPSDIADDKIDKIDKRSKAYRESKAVEE